MVWHSFHKLNYGFLVKSWVLEQSLQLDKLLKKNKKLKSSSNGLVLLSLNLLVLI